MFGGYTSEVQCFSCRQTWSCCSPRLALATEIGRGGGCCGFRCGGDLGNVQQRCKGLRRVLADLGLTLTSWAGAPEQPGLSGDGHAAVLRRPAAQPRDRRRAALPPHGRLPGSRVPRGQSRKNLDSLVEVYPRVVDQVGSADVTILHEPVDTRVDHPGVLVDRMADAFSVIRSVGSKSSGSCTTSTTG